MKRYLVMKTVTGADRAVGLMALPGLYSLEAAEQFVSKAVETEPESEFLIQEVGAA